MSFTYGLIGKKLGHSFSQDWFRNFFARNQVDADYLLFEMESLSAIPKLLRDNPLLRGFNVTIPFKKDILPLCAQWSEEVLSVGAANCIRINHSGLEAFNTDIQGFRHLLSLVPGWKKLPGALVLGTGGAASAVGYVFQCESFPFINISRIKRLPDVLNYDQLDADILRHYPLIVNCTPLGMWPDTLSKPILPYTLLTGAEVLIDLVYNPAETLFLQHGKKQGCFTVNGLPMLHSQADCSWKIWNEVIW